MIEYLVLEHVYECRTRVVGKGWRQREEEYVVGLWRGASKPIADEQLPEALNRLGRESWLLITPLGTDRLIFRRRYREDR